MQLIFRIWYISFTRCDKRFNYILFWYPSFNQLLFQTILHIVLMYKDHIIFYFDILNYGVIITVSIPTSSDYQESVMIHRFDHSVFYRPVGVSAIW